MSSRGGQSYRGRGRGQGQGPPGRGGGGGPSRGGFGGRGEPPRIFSQPGGVPAPDAAVTKLEDALAASKDVDLGRLKLEGDAFPTRPGYGTKGSGVTLWANYVSLSASPKLVLHRYDVSVTPTATGRKLTQVVRLALESPELASYSRDVVSDFKSTLISRTRFDDRTVTIAYRAEGEDEPPTTATASTTAADPPTYSVKLLHTNVLAVADLINYLTSTSASAAYDGKLPMIQAFNIFLNHYAKSAGNLATIGASKTFSLSQDSETWDLQSGLHAIRGFFASVRAATGRILVNVNVSHGAFYQQGPLDQLVLGYGSHRGLFRLEAFIKRLRVRTTHLKDRVNKSGEPIPRIKTVFGLANKNDGHGAQHPPKVKAFGAGPKDVEFWLEASPSAAASSTAAVGGAKGGKKKGAKPSQPANSGGKYISVHDFFSTAYGIHITNPNLPVVNVGTRDKPTYLPLQVCFVLAGQPAKSKLDPSQTQQMIRFAVRRPADNAISILTKGLTTTGLNPETNPLPSQFGITASSTLITVPGRVLISPKVVYRQSQIPTNGGSWNMVPRGSSSLKFTTGGTLQKWSCLFIDMPDVYPRAHKFTSDSLADVITRFHAVLRDVGIAASPPLPPQRLLLADTDDPALDALMQRAASSLQLLFIILPSAPIPLYNRIKHLGDVRHGIHTICSIGAKLAKPQGQDQYFRNEALKFNLKLGGSNHLVEPSRLSLLADDKTMVVGIDVTHPSPGSSAAAPSVAGMVASIDRSLAQWPAVLSIQSQQRQEMVSDLKDMLKSRLRLWRERGRHASLPDNILVYRDGVSEGQYQLVLAHELPLLRDACRESYPPADFKRGLPRLTVVIVGKRHHTRFYPTGPDDADSSGNTRAGTVVDRAVTEARSWDFFLQAHTALQGTARPAHYYVVLDEIFRHKNAKNKQANVADELQELTQAMCFVFGRATKGVSYCTPAYYADILCERARCYLSSLFDSPANSAVPSAMGSVAGGPAASSHDDVRIHDRLMHTMFYI